MQRVMVALDPGVFELLMWPRHQRVGCGESGHLLNLPEHTPKPGEGQPATDRSLSVKSTHPAHMYGLHETEHGEIDDQA